MNPLARPLDYVILLDEWKGSLNRISEPGYDAPRPNVGEAFAYVNLFDQRDSYDKESNTGKYGPYLSATDTAEEYDEGVIDPEGDGWDRNLREQFQLRKEQGYRYVELDNPDAYKLPDVMQATALAETYGLGVIAKNAGLVKGGAQWVAHPNVYGIIIERDAGSPSEMDELRRATGKPDLPCWFVSFGSGRSWANNMAAEAKPYVNMFVTYSSRGEYGSSEDILKPFPSVFEPGIVLPNLGNSMAGADIIAKAKSYIGRFNDGPDVPMLAREVAAKFPDLASYCALASSTTSWCGIFLAKVFSEFGIRPPHKDNDTGGFMWVDAWLDWGTTIPVGQEQPGDIALFLGNPHHITFVAGGGRYVGGNQSDGVTNATFRTPDAIRRAPTAQPIPIVAPARASSVRRFTEITATEFGGSGDPNNSAYDNHFIDDDEFGVALPFRFKGARPKVRVFKGGQAVVCEIVDVGPWNINDPYWETSSRPQAETGTDNTGRRTNSAGIDLTPAAAQAIGLNGLGKVDWEFVGSEPVIILPSKPIGNPMATDDPAVDAILDEFRPILKRRLLQAPAVSSADQARNALIVALGGTPPVGTVAPAATQPEPAATTGTTTAPAASNWPTNLGVGLAGILASLGLSGAGVIGAPAGPDFSMTGLLLPIGIGIASSLGIPAPVVSAITNIFSGIKAAAAAKPKT